MYDDYILTSRRSSLVALVALVARPRARKSESSFGTPYAPQPNDGLLLAVALSYLSISLSIPLPFFFSRSKQNSTPITPLSHKNNKGEETRVTRHERRGINGIRNGRIFNGAAAGAAVAVTKERMRTNGRDDHRRAIGEHPIVHRCTSRTS